MTPWALNLRHLWALPVIAKLGSASRAAQAVHLSQPALAQGLATIERAFGAALFDRRVHGMTPTAEGQAVARRVTAAHAHLTSAIATAADVDVDEARRRLGQLSSAQLRALERVATAGAYASASTQGLRSKGSLHRAIRELEAAVGAPILVRRGRGAMLSPAGQAVAQGVRLAAAELESAWAEVTPSARPNLERLVIGAMPLSRAALLPSAIATATGWTRHLHIRIVEGGWAELAPLLRRGELDLMVGALRDPPPRDMLQIRLFDDQLAIVAGAHHPLIGLPPELALPRLSDFPWIVGRPGSLVEHHWRNLFADRPSPVAPVECGSVMAIRGLLLRTDCLALLSPAQVDLELESGALAILGPPLAGSERAIGLTLRRTWRPTPLQSDFLDLLARHALTLSSQNPIAGRQSDLSPPCGEPIAPPTLPLAGPSSDLSTPQEMA